MAYFGGWGEDLKRIIAMVNDKHSCENVWTYSLSCSTVLVLVLLMIGLQLKWVCQLMRLACPCSSMTFL